MGIIFFSLFFFLFFVCVSLKGDIATSPSFISLSCVDVLVKWAFSSVLY